MTKSTENEIPLLVLMPFKPLKNPLKTRKQIYLKSPKKSPKSLPVCKNHSNHYLPHPQMESSRDFLIVEQTVGGKSCAPKIQIFWVQSSSSTVPACTIFALIKKDGRKLHGGFSSALCMSWSRSRIECRFCNKTWKS